MEANKDSTSIVDVKMPRRPQIYTKLKEKEVPRVVTQRKAPISYPVPDDQA